MTPTELRTLALQAGVDQRTAVRWIAGLRVHAESSFALREACAQLRWGLVETEHPGPRVVNPAAFGGG